MLACVLIPGFELRAALKGKTRLLLQPAALAPIPGQKQEIGAVTAAAETAGVRPGMLLGEALATCPSLRLVEQDPAEAEQAWEEIVCRLEGEGFAVEPAEPGCLYVETRAVERFYGGVEGVLRRALAAVGPGWDARAGAADRKFAALAAASVARAGQILVVASEETPTFLAPLPLGVLQLERERHDELEALGLRTVGHLAALPGAAVAERLGPEGRQAWHLARGIAAAGLWLLPMFGTMPAWDGDRHQVSESQYEVLIASMQVRQHIEGTFGVPRGGQGELPCRGGRSVAGLPHLFQRDRVRHGAAERRTNAHACGIPWPSTCRIAEPKWSATRSSDRR